MTLTHGLSTSPHFARHRIRSGSLPTYFLIASPASSIRGIANGVERLRLLSGKLMSVVAPYTEAPALCWHIDSQRFSLAARRPTQSLPQRGAGYSMPRTETQAHEAGDAIASALATNTNWFVAARRKGTLRARGQCSRIGGVSPLSLVTFFALAPRRKSPWGTKKVTAAPHRGNARAAKAQTRMPAAR